MTVLSELPPGWSTATLLRLAGGAGLVTDGDWIESKDQDPDGAVRLIQLNNIGDGFFVDGSYRFMNTQTAERLNCTYIQPGDLLIARMPEPIGRAAIFPNIEQDAVTAVDVLIWRPDPKFAGADPRWLMYAINSPQVRAVIQSEAGGMTRQRIAGGKLKRLSLQVPPIAEQHRISAKVATISARIERARSDLNKLPGLIERYKQLLLTKGISGNLTEDWRRNKKLAELTEVTLSDVASSFDYGSSAKSSKIGKIPVLRMGNIQDGKLDWSDLVYTSDEREINRYRLYPGDVLFNRTNSPALVGKSAMYQGEREAVYAGYLIRVKCGPRVMPEYLTFCLNSPQGRAFSWRVKTDGVSQSNINAKKLATFQFMLPSLDEQAEIVKQLSIGLSWVDQISSDCAAAARLLHRLQASVLAKAYRGGLVPQDPNDEHAGIMLERVEEPRGTLPSRSKAQKNDPSNELHTDEIGQTNPVSNSSRGGFKMPKSRKDVDVMGKPYLAEKLKALPKFTVRDLYRIADLEVSDFYKQLVWEIEQGYIIESAEMLRAA